MAELFALTNHPRIQFAELLQVKCAAQQPGVQLASYPKVVSGIPARHHESNMVTTRAEEICGGPQLLGCLAYRWVAAAS